MSRRVARAVRRLHGDEPGQVVALVALAFVVVAGMAALAVDVGRLFVAKRQLQAAADAAALAGASALPDTTAAADTAALYGAGTGSKNVQVAMPPVTTSSSAKCLISIDVACRTNGGGPSVNALTVKESANVPLFFAKVLGFASWKVSASSTATMAGGLAQPLDVMIVLDRTGSMGDPCAGTGGATKLDCAKTGIRAFIGALRPSVDRIGLEVFPPVEAGHNGCDSAWATYDDPSNPYVVVPLSGDFKLSDAGAINNSSTLVQTLNCVQAGGTTSYATALEKAQAELNADGRPNAQDVIIFFTDGQATYGPLYYSPTDNPPSPYRTNPCATAVSDAKTITAAGTWLYTIGYSTDQAATCKGLVLSSGCDSPGANDTRNFSCDEQPTITAYSALEQMASDPSKFFFQPSPTSLTDLFQRVAQSLSSARLVSDDSS